MVVVALIGEKEHSWGERREEMLIRDTDGKRGVFGVCGV